jgi:hypothetical protein
MNLRRHLTYANVISTLCLFLVLGGGAAFAATKLAKGSVGTEALKAEAVTKAKLHANSVNSKKVVNGSLTGEDIASSTLGKVPSASAAETATNATHATSADNATNAEKLDGHSPSEFGAVLIANPTLLESLEGELFISVNGTAQALVSSGVSAILPNRRFRASAFTIHLEGEAQVGVSVHASFVVDGAEQELCTLTVVPSTSTPSTTVEIPPAAQVFWKLSSASSVAIRPQFALRLSPN